MIRHVRRRSVVGQYLARAPWCDHKYAKHPSAWYVHILRVRVRARSRPRLRYNIRVRAYSDGRARCAGDRDKYATKNGSPSGICKALKRCLGNSKNADIEVSRHLEVLHT